MEVNLGQTVQKVQDHNLCSYKGPSIIVNI